MLSTPSQPSGQWQLMERPLCLRLHKPSHLLAQGSSGKSCDFSMLCLTPGILANTFFSMFSGYIKSPLLVGSKGEPVGANSRRGTN